MLQQISIFEFRILIRLVGGVAVGIDPAEYQELNTGRTTITHVANNYSRHMFNFPSKPLFQC